MESLPCPLLLPFTQQDGLYQTGYNPLLSNNLEWDQAQNLGTCSPSPLVCGIKIYMPSYLLVIYQCLDVTHAKINIVRNKKMLVSLHCKIHKRLLVFVFHAPWAE